MISFIKAGKSENLIIDNKSFRIIEEPKNEKNCVTTTVAIQNNNIEGEATLKIHKPNRRDATIEIKKTKGNSYETAKDLANQISHILNMLFSRKISKLSPTHFRKPMPSSKLTIQCADCNLKQTIRNS